MKDLFDPVNANLISSCTNCVFAFLLFSFFAQCAEQTRRASDFVVIAVIPPLILRPRPRVSRHSARATELYSLMHLLANPLSKAPLGLQIQNGKFHACWRVLCKVKHPNGPFIMRRARNRPAINTVGEPVFSPSGNQINPEGAVASTARLIIVRIFVSQATPGSMFTRVSEGSGVLLFFSFFEKKPNKNQFLPR